MDPRDAALQASCPVVIAPRFGALPDMSPGQRLVVAANGLFVQVKLDWLDCLHCLASQGPQGLGLPLPYGEAAERLSFSFGVLPIRLIERFVEAGRRALPNEAAGALIFSRSGKTLRLALCEAVRCSPTRIEYRVAAMAEDETIAVDLHTHGRLGAFWSSEDDRDDRGIKVAGVFGRLHEARPDACFRLVINGLYRPLPHPWETSATDRPSAQEPAVERRLLQRLLARWSARG
ncbi:MAG: PRTRC system protein A [Burkholderiales bacterium]|nr:PRTRC system protein A [Burkholderiales bacterium]